MRPEQRKSKKQALRMINEMIIIADTIIWRFRFMG
jgi:hypothetical protein